MTNDSNRYFYRASLVWKRLKDIRDGKIQYCADDYFILINELERYYKGFLWANTRDNKYFPDEYFEDHDYVSIVGEIERLCKLNLYKTNCLSDIKERNNLLREIRKDYSLNGESVPGKDEYDRLFDLVLKQKRILQSDLLGLNKNNIITIEDYEDS